MYGSRRASLLATHCTAAICTACNATSAATFDSTLANGTPTIASTFAAAL